MYYQLRIAEKKDVQAIKAFIEKAGLRSDGMEEFVEYFALLESDGQITATLGVEPVGGDGLLRSLAVSESMNQAHLLSLFESVYALAKEKGMGSCYLVANSRSAVDFLSIIGFQAVEKENIPLHLLQSAHFKESFSKEHAEVMAKTS